MRHVYLDGMRGWACASVVLAHTYGSIYAGDYTAADAAVSIFAEGGFAVKIFFVVSGFALAGVRDRDAIAVAALARIPRLFAPALVAVYVGLALDPHRQWWGALAYPVCLLANSYLKTDESVMASFFPHRMMEPHWVSQRFGQLWTMNPEIWGSFFVFAWSYGALGDRRPVLAAIGALLFLSNYNVLFFLLGARLHAAGPADADYSGAASAAAAAGLHYVAFFALPRIRIVALRGVVGEVIVVLRVLLVFRAVRRSPRTRAFFEFALSRFMGRISFCVYVYHNIAKLVLFDYVYWGDHFRADAIDGHPAALRAHGAATLLLSIALGAAATPLQEWSTSKAKQLAAYSLARCSTDEVVPLSSSTPCVEGEFVVMQAESQEQ